METEVMFSQQTDVWGTPQWLFDALHKEFGFTLDPCSDGTNAKCERFFSIYDSGLVKEWGTETVFMNPPYSQCEDWMRKAYGAAQEGATVVCLVPARTDTEWWHRYAMKGEIRLLKGRLKFGEATNRAPFPSAVIVFRPRTFQLVAWDARAAQRKSHRLAGLIGESVWTDGLAVFGENDGTENLGSTATDGRRLAQPHWIQLAGGAVEQSCGCSGKRRTAEGA